MSLFSELKRRNVFKIGAAYLIVAWLLMQVTDLAVPALMLPGWVTTFVVFILLLGFPVALVLAWAFEVTPEGIRQTRDLPLEKRVTGQGSKRLAYGVIALLAVAVAILLLERTGTETESGPAGDGHVSIAVLPFENLSGDSAQEHFVDGLTEELLNSLAGISGFRVISRTSSFTYKGRDVPVPDIAEALDVSHLLEGSVRRVGNRIRVTAQLIDASTDSHVWFENFDREMTLDNILEIQEVVAMTVADRLQVKLLPTSLRATGPASLEALQHYHDGMYYVRRMELFDFDDEPVEMFEAGRKAFEASIDADSNWAPAHAGLGMLYHFNRTLGSESEQLRVSRLHVERALELDNTLGRAWNSLGFINTVEGDYEAALAAYDTARKYNSDYHWGLALLYDRLGRFDESVEEYRSALRANPLSRPIRWQLIGELYCAGDYHEMIERAAEFARLEPDNPGIRAMLADGYVAIGDIENALRLAEEVASAFRSDEDISYILAKAGLEDRARAAIHSTDVGQYWPTHAPAAVVLGEEELALDILEAAVDEGSSGEPSAFRMFERIRCMPELVGLKGNPRFDALMERVNLAN